MTESQNELIKDVTNHGSGEAEPHLHPGVTVPCLHNLEGHHLRRRNGSGQGLGCGSSKAADRCLGQLALDSLAVCGSSNCLPMSRLVAKTVLVGLVTACMQRAQSIAGGTTRAAAPMAALHGGPDDDSEPTVGKGWLEQSRVQSRRT